MTFPRYWPSADHALWWTQMGVSIILYYNQTLRVSPMPVGRIEVTEIQGELHLVRCFIQCIIVQLAHETNRVKVHPSVVPSTSDLY